MPRTKKSAAIPQEEQNLTPSEVPTEDIESGMTPEEGVTDGAQDLLELAAPEDGADSPLLLPATAEEGDDSVDSSEGIDADATPGSDWPTEESTPIAEEFDPESIGAEDPSDENDGGDSTDGEEFGAGENLAVSEDFGDAEESTGKTETVEDAGEESLMGGGVNIAAPVISAPAKAPRSRTKSSAAKPTAKPRRPTATEVLTIERRTEVETAASREEILWHEIQNAARTRRILTGSLGGIERLENGNSVAVVYYKELRVIIPIKEMMLRLGGENPGYGSMSERENKILGNMLGCDIDFVLKGIDSKTRSAVASRREAMLRKRKTFFVDADAATGQPRIHEGRIVQARVIAVASKVVRVEVFGVETSIMARDLSWEWIGDAHERFSVGDKILVRVNKIRMESIEELSIQADARSMTANTVAENLKKCRVQGKYAGSVTDIHKGVVFVRLFIGINAIAHSCLDSRMPAKQDEVSFVVTHIDSEQGVAMGLITRIIKQKI